MDRWEPTAREAAADDRAYWSDVDDHDYPDDDE